jgi:hypothetical protein
LSTWVTRDLEAVLDELAAPEREREVVVTIHLASGQRMTGHVRELVRDRRGATLGVQSLPQRGSVELDITVIPLARVEAVTVHGAVTAAPRENKPAEATSLLELKRRARALAEQLTAQVGAPLAIEIDAGELVVLAPLLEQVRLVLEHVCADELGRAALGQRVRTVRLAIGTSPGVALANQTLTATSALDQPLAGARLQSAIDALL